MTNTPVVDELPTCARLALLVSVAAESRQHCIPTPEHSKPTTNRRLQPFPWRYRPPNLGNFDRSRSPAVWSSLRPVTSHERQGRLGFLDESGPSKLHRSPWNSKAQPATAQAARPQPTRFRPVRPRFTLTLLAACSEVSIKPAKADLVASRRLDLEPASASADPFWPVAVSTLPRRLLPVPCLSGGKVPRAPPPWMYRYLAGAEMGHCPVQLCGPCGFSAVQPGTSFPPSSLVALMSHPLPSNSIPTSGFFPSSCCSALLETMREHPPWPTVASCV